ncbi:MAG: SMP-30/gluconolactonase/LRE family protein [Betaproteobacteria bacterium]|nr:SMP-30/gluconolactonase/LRE family protein [Betaproteobacteria bacterium]
MYAAPPLVETVVFASLPGKYHKPARVSKWVAARRKSGGPPRSNAMSSSTSWLVGPAFDRAGNLFCADIPFGRIFRLSRKGEWGVFAEYDGEPSGLKIHRDGRIFVADHKRGLLVFDPKTARMSVVLDAVHHEPFRGLSDLTFASNGDLYFTDQGQSALQDPSGRVYRLRASGELDLLLEGLEGPNGLVLNQQETTLYVSVTRANRIVSIPLLPGYQGLGKCGIYIQLSGSPNGPDGLAVDEAGNLVVVVAGFGTAWMFSRLGEPLLRIKSCAGMSTTDAAYGGPDRRTLFITEAQHGVILKTRVPSPGKRMYSHV